MLKLRNIEYADIPEIVALTREVATRMPEPSHFVSTDEECLVNYLHDEVGVITGACDEQGRIAAYTILTFPGRSEDNLGRELGISEDELPLVASLDTTIVHEDARGQGLQLQFHRHREQIARSRGMRYLYATVHPDNAYSIRNLEAAGLTRRFTRFMYGGLPRHCYAKELHPADQAER
ncbi:GNAT family N-acetyltransferase [Paenibacillus sp. NPDC058071]|uniref:GNAT family N-acetyltransferase n=1 Tax=Paenibacillus sp. NPDC058071 TaxID=3346326 RepID=UPI0036DCE95F